MHRTSKTRIAALARMFDSANLKADPPSLRHLPVLAVLEYFKLEVIGPHCTTTALATLDTDMMSHLSSLEALQYVKTFGTPNTE
jgi:hypothetical protein